MISCFSFFLNLQLHHFLFQNYPIEISRFLCSGCLFFVGYLLHKKYTFSEYKKVGIAVYAHGNEDISGIFHKIGPIGDFIHIDIVDKTFNLSAPDPVAPT